MTIYSKDSTQDLNKILIMMAKDKKALVSAGFKEAADQNQQVIDAIMSELNSRAEVSA